MFFISMFLKYCEDSPQPSNHSQEKTCEINIRLISVIYKFLINCLCKSRHNYAGSSALHSPSFCVKMAVFSLRDSGWNSFFTGLI